MEPIDQRIDRNESGYSEQSSMIWGSRTCILRSCTKEDIAGGRSLQTLTEHLLSLPRTPITTDYHHHHQRFLQTLLPALSCVNCASWGYSFLSVCKQPFVLLRSSRCTPNLQITSRLHTWNPTTPWIFSINPNPNMGLVKAC
jgi:hypothetical protein